MTSRSQQGVVEKLHRSQSRLFSILMFFWSSVARIALVKPDKAKGVEDDTLRGAQYGQITEKVCGDSGAISSLTDGRMYFHFSWSAYTLRVSMQVSEERPIQILE